MTAQNDNLEALAREFGVDFFGVAELTAARAFLLQQGGQQIAAFPRAVSLGIRLLDAIVDELYRHDEPSAIYTYRGLYNSVNASLDRAALFVAKRLQAAGHEAYPIPASQTISDQKLEGAFSHKLAAHLAGLGWIGKSCLLITPECGPRVRWATVLTDAPLSTGTPAENRCGTCRDCVEICPVSAFTGVPFNPTEPRVVRFKAHKCKTYTDGRLRRIGEGICGLCVHICPHGVKGRVSRRP